MVRFLLEQEVGVRSCPFSAHCSQHFTVTVIDVYLLSVAVLMPSPGVVLAALPFLKNTVVLLYPFALLGLVYVLSVSLGWNFTQGLCWFYKYRVQ